MTLVHGSPSGYLVHKCRCDRCTKARSDYLKKWRADNHRKMISGVARPEHGTSNTYINYECRCVLCTEANRLYSKRMRDQKRKRDASVDR